MTAKPRIDDRLLDAAEAWHLALDCSDADWDAFTLWLEADPEHREAFDAVALTHRIVDEHLDNLDRPAIVRSARARPRNAWITGAIAATLAVVVAVPALWPRAGKDIVYATARGETRHLALGSGIAVDLAPSTRLIVTESNPATLELAQGDAVFTVAHDPARRLSIKAGGYAVADIGTTFGVTMSGQALKVGVAEGHLTVTPDGGEATRVSAGQQLIAPRSGEALRVGTVAAQDVGSWRTGRLVYSDTPLSVVAADISRYSGKAVTVDPAIGDQSFSGVLAIGDGSRLLASLSDILGVSYEETADSARLGAPAR